MFYRGSIEDAIAHCRSKSSVLVVLARPALSPDPPPPSETPAAKYTRVADASLSKLTLPSPLVRNSLFESDSALIQVRQGTPEYDSFAKLFPVEKLPSVFMIGNHGEILVHKKGFVSVAEFVGSLQYAIQVIKADPGALLATTMTLLAKAASSLPSSPAAKPPSDSTTSTNPAPPSQEEPSLRPEIEPVTPQASSTESDSPPPQPATLPKRTREPSTCAECSISIRNIDGSVTRKVFPSHERFGAVREYVAQSCSRSVNSFRLSTPFPRRFFDPADDAKQLVELELCPSATLTVTAVERNVITLRGLRQRIWKMLAKSWEYCYQKMMWLKAMVWGTGRARARGVQAGGAQDRRSGGTTHKFTSMADMRRAEREEGNDKNKYWNGNSTQFGSNDYGRKND